MPTLHIGVIDVPYGPTPASGKKKKKAAPTVSTGDVAEFLEAKYHPVEIFYQVHQGQVAEHVTESLRGAMESMMMGAPVTLDPFGSAGSEIAKDFRKFITSGEMERLGYPGVPTQAAIKGVNHRLLHPYAKANKRRPSFVDTSNWVDSAKAWID